MNIVRSIWHGLGNIFSWFFSLTLLKKIIIIVIVFVITFLAYRTLHKTTATPTYQTATVEKGTLISNVTASGTISSGSNTSITTEATGVVNEVFVKNGDLVTQGQTIATVTLDSSSQQKQTAAYASYLSAQNNLNAAKSKMNSLQSALFKANQTFVTGAGTQNPTTDDPRYIEQNADWQQAEADYTNQSGVIAAAEASLSSAWLSYSQTSSTITAPISGTIANLSIAPGTNITSNSSSSNSSNSNTSNTTSSQTVGTIVLADSKVQAAVNLTEIDVTKVKVGQKVTLTMDAFPDKTFTGKVSAIDTTGSTSSGVTTYPTTITFDTALDTMYPNMAVSATIITNVKNDVLLVPTSAVTTSDGVSTVRVLRNGQPMTITVEIGDTSDTETEVTSGLSEGDTIITTAMLTGTGTTRTTGTSASPFGNSGFGGIRTFGGGGGGGGARRAGGG